MRFVISSHFHVSPREKVPLENHSAQNTCPDILNTDHPPIRCDKKQGSVSYLRHFSLLITISPATIRRRKGNKLYDREVARVIGITKFRPFCRNVSPPLSLAFANSETRLKVARRRPARSDPVPSRARCVRNTSRSMRKVGDAEVGKRRVSCEFRKADEIRDSRAAWPGKSCVKVRVSLIRAPSRGEEKRGGKSSLRLSRARK